MYHAHTETWGKLHSRQNCTLLSHFSAHRVVHYVPILSHFLWKLRTRKPHVEIRAVCVVSAGNSPNCNGKLGVTAGIKHWQRFNIRSNKIRTREHHVRVPFRMHLICAMLRDRVSSNSTGTKIETVLIQIHSIHRGNGSAGKQLIRSCHFWYIATSSAIFISKKEKKKRDNKSWL